MTPDARHPCPTPVYYTPVEVKDLFRNRDYYIYALSDSDTLEVRYVGKSNRLMKRIDEHLLSARKGDMRRYSSRWIKTLLEANKGIVVSILEHIQVDPETTWEDREKYWIKRLKDEGYRLTNLAEGGMPIPTRCEPVKHLLPQTKTDLRHARKGKPCPSRGIDRTGKKAAHLAKLHQHYRDNPEERRWGHHTPESKAKISAAHTGTKHNITQENRVKMAARASVLGAKSAIIIVAIDVKTNQATIYPSTKAASIALNISRTGICNCLRGRAKTAGGIKWMTASEYTASLSSQHNHDNTI